METSEEYAVPGFGPFPKIYGSHDEAQGDCQELHPEAGLMELQTMDELKVDLERVINDQASSLASAFNFYLGSTKKSFTDYDKVTYRSGAKVPKEMWGYMPVKLPTEDEKSCLSISMLGNQLNMVECVLDQTPDEDGYVARKYMAAICMLRI